MLSIQLTRSPTTVVSLLTVVLIGFGLLMLEIMLAVFLQFFLPVVFPALVMLLFWKGTTKQGIVASVLVGMISSLGWILVSSDTYNSVYGLDPADALAPFSQPGIVTIPLGFITLVVVSLLTKKQTSGV